MRLTNDVYKEWDGWLVDRLGGKEEAYQQMLVATLQAHNIPNCTVKTGTLNMWWRKNSTCIDVMSTLDGNMMTTIHIQEYGTGLGLVDRLSHQSTGITINAWQPVHLSRQ